MSEINMNFAETTESAILPKYVHNRDYGVGLHIVRTGIIEETLKTSLKYGLPHNYDSQIRPRSEASTMITACGTVYSGRIISGEIKGCFKGNSKKIILMFEVDL